MQETDLFCYRLYVDRDDSRLALSQWEMWLQRNSVSHWLGANLESALCWYMQQIIMFGPEENGRKFADNIYRGILLEGIFLFFNSDFFEVCSGLVNYESLWVQVMAQFTCFLSSTTSWWYNFHCYHHPGLGTWLKWLAPGKFECDFR